MSEAISVDSFERLLQTVKVGRLEARRGHGRTCKTKLEAGLGAGWGVGWGGWWGAVQDERIGIEGARKCERVYERVSERVCACEKVKCMSNPSLVGEIWARWLP